MKKKGTGSIQEARNYATITQLKKLRARGLYRPGEQAGFIRLGKAVTDIMVRPEMYDFDSWTTEELRRGRRASEDGMFRGNDPMIIPKEIVAAYTRRVNANAQKHFEELMETALGELEAIVTGADVEPKDKLTAIKLIKETVMGKDDQTVRHKFADGEEEPWKAVLSSAIVSDPGDPEEGIAPVEPITNAEPKPKPKRTTRKRATK